MTIAESHSVIGGECGLVVDYTMALGDRHLLCTLGVHDCRNVGTKAGAGRILCLDQAGIRRVAGVLLRLVIHTGNSLLHSDDADLYSVDRAVHGGRQVYSAGGPAWIHGAGDVVIAVDGSVYQRGWR